MQLHHYIHGKPLKIAGVVVLYHPDNSAVDNIKSYMEYVELLYVVDNSSVKNDAIISFIKSAYNTVYVDNEGNQGIAHALNVGAQRAVQAGFDWLLTMDQDSFVPDDIVTKMLTAAGNNFNIDEIAIISPTYFIKDAVKTISTNHSDKFAIKDSRNSHIASRISITMTSGNLLNLSIFSKSGPFNTAFFIDHVDHEYCLRCKKNGYLTVEVADAKLQHAPGKAESWHAFGFTMKVPRHPSLRYYYQARNLIWLYKAYYRTDLAILNPLLNAFLRRFLKVFLASPRYEKWCCTKHFISGIHSGIFLKSSD